MLAENTILVAGLPRLPSSTAPLDLCVGDPELNQALVRVEGDYVAILDDRDRPADSSLGGHMSDEPTPRGAREACIGNQGDRTRAILARLEPRLA